jgi:hypothetical protein
LRQALKARRAIVSTVGRLGSMTSPASQAIVAPGPTGI